MDNFCQEIELIFETSWEVCNKIGGIYTVLSSKAKTLKSEFKDKLIFIGPDVWSETTPSPYFEESKTLLKKWKESELPDGLTVRVGWWNIPGRPIAILVKFDNMYASKDEAYGRMWELFGVDSLHAYGDYDEGCAFARASAKIIESLVSFTNTNPMNVLAHFDEWTTAIGLLTLKAEMPEIATVFTTHATSIGRSICGNGKPLYDYLDGYNGDQMARELNMEAKHSLEKAAAHYADAFTTVSDVTDTEAAQLLEKKATVVTPNGFEPNFVPGKIKYAAARKTAREKMLSVAASLTGQEYCDDTFILATSGRCEYRNKGIDMFLDAMNMLQNSNINRKILAFVLVPAWVKDKREDLSLALDAKRTERLVDPIITHTINNYNEDPIFGRIHQLHFANDSNAKVDVIYVPCYLDGKDGIFDLTYYDMLPGLDATVFASYYEPWGYTPLESIAFGVPTVTTTLAGFGRWILSEWPEASFATCGTEVVERTDSNYSQATEEISSLLARIVNASSKECLSYRKAAMAAAQRADWENFISYYRTAYNDAAQNRKLRQDSSIHVFKM